MKQTLLGHSDCIQSIALTDNSLISGSWDKTIKIWDLMIGKVKNTLTNHKNWVI